MTEMNWSPEQVAAAALLVNAARIDGCFSEEERMTITAGLQGYFGLSLSDAQSLVQQGANHVGHGDVHPLSQILRTRLSDAQRQELAFMVRDVVYSDGVLDPIEAHLLQSLYQLLNIPADDVYASRKRVLDALGITRAALRNTHASPALQDV